MKELSTASSNNKRPKGVKKSPTKSRPLMTPTWKETGTSTLLEPSTTLESLIEEDILITPETLLSQSSSKNTPPSTKSSHTLPEELPTKDANVNILDLLAKKDNLKKIASSVEQQLAPMSTVPTTTSLPSTPFYSKPTKATSQKEKNSPSSSSTNKTVSAPPRAPSPPTKQPAAHKRNPSPKTNSRTPSPTKTSSNNASSPSGITSINNSNSTTSSELRFAGPAFHNSPAPSELPLPPMDFFSNSNSKPRETSYVKLPSDNPKVTLISRSPPTRDSPSTSFPVDSVRVNFSKELPEFQQVPPQHQQLPVHHQQLPVHHQPALFPFPPSMVGPMLHPSWPVMMPQPLSLPPAQPVMLDQMSNQLKMILNIS